MRISEKIGSYFKPSTWKNSKKIKASYATVVAPVLAGLAWGVAKLCEGLGDAASSLRGRVQVKVSPKDNLTDRNYKGTHPATIEANAVKIPAPTKEDEEWLDAPDYHFKDIVMEQGQLSIPLDKYSVRYESKRDITHGDIRQITVTQIKPGELGISVVYKFKN